MDLAIAGCVVTAVGLIGLLVASQRESQLGAWLTKPLASAGFLVAAYGNGALHTRYGQFIFAALVLSWIGDVLLIPHSKLWFQAGLFSFLLGHVGFGISFYFHGVMWRAAAGAAILLVAVALTIGRWLLPHVENKMRPPVIAYIVVISSMVALAVGATVAGGTPLIIVGAIAFFLSDLSVARDTFVKRGFVNRLWGLPLYYGAQLIFAFSIAR
jgi:uncharacterized membrane protein YhhN